MSYTGKISTSGNSEAIRLDKNLFKQHPEFRQQANVRADVIAPGTMLLQLVDNEGAEIESDPMVTAFLAFLEKDAIENPSSITPVSEKQMAEISALVDGVVVTEDDDLG
ncbi:MAG: hypothetical protein JSS86_08560 [Cyanobacteria bacterium SZAS LIN-2]|nr:hypothetical protein [Cyanobacteria bacterium SZAS LIN-2]